jgi:Lytic transglycolase
MSALSKPLTSRAVVTVQPPRHDDLKSQRQLAAKQASTLSRASSRVAELRYLLRSAVRLIRVSRKRSKDEEGVEPHGFGYRRFSCHDPIALSERAKERFERSTSCRELPGLSGGIVSKAICLCLVVFLAACAAESARESIPPAITPQPQIPPAPRVSAKPSKTVKASYQGSGTAGQPTASGERYNPNDLTAASRNLPIGSTVKVTNPDTGRSVKVRINDRGPFVRGRSLDLSKSAAEQIGITHKGVARVEVTPAKSHPVANEPEAPSPVATPTRY